MAGDSFLTFIDGFGQFAHRDWPGKIHTDQDLTSQRSVEAATLVAPPGPDQRSTYGGWTAGPRFEATGFFRVVQHAGVWWFVDPEGYLFWSHGIDCVASRYGATGVTEREGYFADLPELDHVMARFYGTGNWAPHGFYKDRIPYRTYHHRGANLWRKYGDQWPEEFADVSHRRLASWGMNTIGNWSDRELYLQRRTPYVTTAWLDGADKPVIIGEFHFGALDRGMFHPGLKQARDQPHRAELYRSYVQSALAHPLIIGTHWFQ